MEMFFLSYVDKAMYMLWNLPFFKSIPLKTNFFFIFFFFPSNLRLIMAQQTSTHVNCFMTHLVPFYLKNAYCGREAW